MKTFFMKMLDSRDPSVSSSRFLAIVTVITVLYTWAIVSIWTRTMQDLGGGVTTLVIAVIAGSVGNKLAEKPDIPNTTTTIDTSSKTEVKTI